MKRFLFAFCSLLLGASACSSSSSGTTADGAIRRIAAAECEQIARCDLGGDAEVRAAASSTADCTDNLDAVSRTEFDANAFVEDGTVRIDEDNLAACLAAMDSCVPNDSIPACNLILVGTLDEGEGCVDGVQCVSGVCTAVPGQCGTCAAAAGLGEACNPVLQNCAPSAEGDVTCQSGVTGSTCVLDAVTSLVVSLDDNCDPVDGVDRFCESPYYCDQDDVCAERKAEGSPCDLDFDECVFGTACAETSSGTQCVAVVDVTTANEACGLLADGTFARCDAGRDLYCGENGSGDPVCLALAGSGAENGECLEDSDCDAGLVCVIDDALETPGTCETTGKPVGAPCDVARECESQVCETDPVTFEGSCAAAPVCA